MLIAPMVDMIFFPVIENVTSISPSVPALAEQEWEKISALARDSAAKAAVLSSAVRINAKIIVLTLFGVVFVII